MLSEFATAMYRASATGWVLHFFFLANKNECHSRPDPNDEYFMLAALSTGEHFPTWSWSLSSASTQPYTPSWASSGLF